MIGGGSWATALVKILTDNNYQVTWWMRNETAIEHLKKYANNPNYLSSVNLNMKLITLSHDLNETLKENDLMILAVPAAFLKTTLATADSKYLEGKILVSAIKGIVPEDNLIIGEFLHKTYFMPFENLIVISGPCHAEEVALEKLSYLTLACQDVIKATEFGAMLENRYIKTNVIDDIYGTEYSAVLKNIYAIASGICKGLGYGDNFQAVLISNAIQEIKSFVDVVHPISRDIKGSAYLGDLLVTAYSPFSRNRTFGQLIGLGHSVKSAQLEMNMIAEGYYAVGCMHIINRHYKVEMPICRAVYAILYENISAKMEMHLLEDLLC